MSTKTPVNQIKHIRTVIFGTYSMVILAVLCAVNLAGWWVLWLVLAMASAGLAASNYIILNRLAKEQKN